MNTTINVKKFGLAIGLSLALLYFGCALIMTIFGHNGTVNFFNSLLHGLDVSNIVRVDVPLGESVIGIIATFIIGWQFGVCIAAIYNASLNKK
jgi:hypothetical protein